VERRKAGEYGKGKRKKEATKEAEKEIGPKRWAGSAAPKLRLPPSIVVWLCA